MCCSSEAIIPFFSGQGPVSMNCKAMALFALSVGGMFFLFYEAALDLLDPFKNTSIWDTLSSQYHVCYLIRLFLEDKTACSF